MNDLTYIYHFSTNREIELTIKREKGQLPRFMSSINACDLNSQEEYEYLVWRQLISKDIFDELTKEENELLSNYYINKLGL